MSDKVTGGEVVAALLERAGVTAAFGVISIHNMPILDAFGRRNRIRFVPARSEGGAVNMADAFTRVSGGMGVALSSTGTAAGNTCGAMVEAETAGTPMLHITGQIELPYLDKSRGYIHEARDQLGMLRAVSKAAYRVWSADTLAGTMREAIRVARTPPTGPVSVEIPIDIQEGAMTWPADLEPLPVHAPEPAADALDALARALEGKRRPLLWLGGGARGAAKEVARLVELGFGVVSSVQGRGIVPEDHPQTLGAFNATLEIEQFYATCDAMLVVGSRLRGNETLRYTLKLPRPLYQIDADPTQQGRAYTAELFVAGDAAKSLAVLAERLAGKIKIDPKFAADLAAARKAAEASLRAGLGPYAELVDALHAAMPRGSVWVRDVTVSNSTWGNRMLRVHGPRDGVHALGGGIGQGVPMAIGAALAADERKTVVLAGDGGLHVSLGELATLVQEKPNVTLIVMNDRGYGVIRNIQDAKFDGRRYFVDLHTPDMGELARTLGLQFFRAKSTGEIPSAVKAAVAHRGPALLEIDMNAIGPFAAKFAGPPVRKS
jgi:acetolactate synthase-1/2/3 large subunit